MKLLEVLENLDVEFDRIYRHFLLASLRVRSVKTTLLQNYVQ